MEDSAFSEENEVDVAVFCSEHCRLYICVVKNNSESTSQFAVKVLVDHMREKLSVKEQLVSSGVADNFDLSAASPTGFVVIAS